jgi:predicted 2-oxoglutarate/Fe(II)-dependent dioxygenase YbiX
MPHALIPDDSFPPGRNDPCYCGSGRRFKHCCGVASVSRTPPHGVEIVEDFMPPDERREFVAMADSMDGRRFTALDPDGNEVPDEHRVTEWVSFRDTRQRMLDEIVARAFAEHIIPRTGRTIEWYEEPELLRYTPGGFYLYHADAHLFVPEQRAWRKAVDRDISLLIYPNDDYEGGELVFKRLLYTLRPKAGMLVWFPSDVRFEHMAKPVVTGRRYALVSWAAVSGIERVQAERANRSISWATREKKPA